MRLVGNVFDPKDLLLLLLRNVSTMIQSQSRVRQVDLQNSQVIKDLIQSDTKSINNDNNNQKG
ncbi:MAG TPA: hypothetical protein VE593_11785, partial [Nitrososphaeraceae archaeon]|nr:hypothetical protein [Nitrososphaeraceae archaeon]